MKVLDLFSGIGGFSLGLRRAGMQTKAFCEIDPFCQKVLAKHWPKIKIHEDIRELDGKKYKKTIDLVCGGFPCQPFSSAGKRRGAADDRYLWAEMLRIIRQVQPAWIIVENVIGFEYLALDDCVADMERAGYAFQIFDLPAISVGARHRRHRLWIVANAVRDGRRRGNGNNESSGHENGDLATPSEKRRQIFARETWPDDETPNRRFRTLCPTEPALSRRNHGVSSWMDRYRSLGNAVVPAVVKQIGTHIMQIEKESKNEQS